MTIKYKGFDISVEKYSFSDSYDTWNYICIISNNDDRYYMVFSCDGLSDDEVFKECMRRLECKNRNSVKITTNNIYKFIEDYKDEIDKFNKNYDVEIREV